MSPSAAPPRLVLMTTTDLAALNASSLHFLGLAKALINRGVEVQVLARQPSGPLSVQLPSHAAVTFTPALSRLPSAASIPLMWPQMRRLAPGANLYVRSGIGTLALVRAARGFGFKKIVVEANGWLSDDLAMIGSGVSWQAAARRLQIAEANTADGVRVVTQGLGEVFVESGIPASKLHHIPNGTDLDMYQPGNRAAARQSLDIALDAVVLVFIGNLWPPIDLLSIFKALALISGSVSNLELLIVGDGMSRHDLEAEADLMVPVGVRLRWMGALAPAIANKVLAAADVALAPFISARNRRIGLSPLKLHDYAAAGRVVVATDLPGISDYRSEPWLHLAAAHDAASYAQAIVGALGSDMVAAEAAARATAEARFGWSIAAEKIAALF